MGIRFQIDGDHVLALSVAVLFVVSLAAFIGGSAAYYNYRQGLCDRGYTSVQAGENVRFLLDLSPQYLDLGYPGASAWENADTAAVAHLWTALKRMAEENHAAAMRCARATGKPIVHHHLRIESLEELRE